MSILSWLKDRLRGLVGPAVAFDRPEEDEGTGVVFLILSGGHSETSIFSWVEQPGVLVGPLGALTGVEDFGLVVFWLEMLAWQDEDTRVGVV